MSKEITVTKVTTQTSSIVTTGPQGAQGAQGAQGDFGGESVGYKFSTNTAASDPTSGYLKLNNIDLTLATVLYIDDENSDAVDIQPFLRSIDDSTSNTIKGHFRISKKTDSSEFVLFTISSLTENSGYFTVNCSYVSGSVNTFLNDENIIISFARVGDLGPQGYQGFQGVGAGLRWGFSTLTANSDPGAATVRFNSGTMSSVTEIYIDDLSYGSVDAVNWLDSLGNSTADGIKGILTVKTLDDAYLANFNLLSSSQQSGYHKLTVTRLSGSNFVPANFSILYFTFSARGDQGTGQGARYYYSATVTDTDPGSGALKFNSLSAPSITYIYVSKYQYGTVDTSSWFDTFDDSSSVINGTIIIRDYNDLSNLIFTTTGSVVSSGGYYKIPVTYVSGTLTGFSTSRPYYMSFFRNGDKGDAATIAVGTQSTGVPGSAVSVTNSGDSSNAVFNFSIPQGYQGSAATIAVGTQTTGAAGSSVSVTNAGTSSNAVFNFSIPQGYQGSAATIAVGTQTTGAPGSAVSVTNGGTSSNAVFNFSIPQGYQGSAATIAVGTQTTGAPGSAVSVTNAGTSSNAVFNFSIPQGYQGFKGDQGAAATIAVGTQTTGAPGSAVSVTNSGNSNAAVFNFSIPQGYQGLKGDQGYQGADGDIYKSTSSTSLTIASSGSITFTTGLNLDYTIRQSILVYYNSSNYMYGFLTAYNAGTGSMTVDLAGSLGSGTYTSWEINLFGGGQAGPGVASGGTTGQFLVKNSNTSYDTTWLATPLPIANGGTNSTATATAGGVGYGTGTAHAYTAAGTSGQVLSSNGSSAPAFITPKYVHCTFSPNTRPTSPTVGQMIYETDTGRQLVYYGATTGWRPPWNMPWGYVYDTTYTGANITAGFGAWTIMNTWSGSVDVANRRYKATATMSAFALGNGQFNVGIGGSAGILYTQSYEYLPNGYLASFTNHLIFTTIITTYTLTQQFVQSTGSGGGQGLSGSTLIIEDLGPVGNPPAA